MIKEGNSKITLEEAKEKKKPKGSWWKDKNLKNKKKYKLLLADVLTPEQMLFSSLMTILKWNLELDIKQLMENDVFRT